MSDQQTPDAIFISFHEGIPESLDIAHQLQEFFKGWGRECSLVMSQKKKAPPEKTIHEELMRTSIFLQLFTVDPEPSDWMKEEMSLFGYEIGRRNPSPHRGDVVKYLYTQDTVNALETDGGPDRFSHFRSIQTQTKEGRLHLVRIDQPEDAQRLLSAILFEDRYPGKDFGDIVLPECCRQDTALDYKLQDLRTFLGNFVDAYERGLKGVFAVREKAQRQIEAALHSLKPKEMARMIGFTLRSYVDPDKGGTGRAFEAAMGRGAEARLLLLNPNSQAGRQRMAIESPGVPSNKTTLCQDSQEVAKKYAGDEWKEKVKIRYYSTPYFGMVLFPDRAFVEIYHLGHDGEKEEEGKGELICGRVPIMVLQKGTPFYRLFASHFDSIWHMSRARKTQGE